MHEPRDKDARAFAAVRTGDGRPLVPPEVQERGTALEIALAAIDRLNSLKRRRSRALHRSRPVKRQSGT
jgi:hypothetical protein